MNNQSLTDTIKHKLEDFELDRRLEEAAKAAEQAMLKALDALGGFANEHRDDITQWLDKAESAIQSRTDGKYSGQVASVKAQVQRGVTTLADRVDPHRPDTDQVDNHN